ncbi:MAG: glycoside hydrolase family 5 protein [Candidatus Methylacidiphilales bacterium]|nr:cellulase family glycosylhydrolase [Candidatus Methylacidiphilales bacterium]
MKNCLFPSLLILALCLHVPCGLNAQNADYAQTPVVAPAPASAPAEPTAPAPAAPLEKPAANGKPVTPPSEEPEPAKFPPEIKVAGNRLHDKNGKEVWLQGVHVVSLEWNPKGESVMAATKEAIENWKANVIRLSIKDDFWYGKGGKNAPQNDGGVAYRQLIQDLVTLAANRGAYVVIDHHRFGYVKEEHLPFWKEVAEKYKNHPAVLFDIMNEPHGISWEIWRNGGTIVKKEKKPKDAPKVDETAFLSPEEKAKNESGPYSPGMQKLVEAVRETGAKNIVIAGGLDYAYDLTGVAEGFALEDKTGNGIMYATHIYPWKRNWEAKVLPTAAKYPIFVGEVGGQVKKLAFIPASAQEDPYTWGPDVIGFIQKYRLNWTAFSFHPKAAPVMISDWQFTPTPFWGAPVKEALSGKQFEMKKMR